MAIRDIERVEEQAWPDQPKYERGSLLRAIEYDTIQGLRDHRVTLGSDFHPMHPGRVNDLRRGDCIYDPETCVPSTSNYDSEYSWRVILPPAWKSLFPDDHYMELWPCMGLLEGMNRDSEVFRVIAEWLKHQRTIAGFNQTELGKRIGFPQQAISDMERGRFDLGYHGDPIVTVHVDALVIKAIEALGHSDFVADDLITRDGIDAIWTEKQEREKRERMQSVERVKPELENLDAQT